MASCGFDKCVKIWQYFERSCSESQNWILRDKIQEFSDSIEDIAFCPNIFGLKLAACTFNGKLKIFEPSDLNNNTNWNRISSKDVSNVGCSSISWNPSLVDSQSLVVGCYYDPKKDNRDELIQIFVYSEMKKDYIFNCSLKNSENGHKDTVTDVEWCNQFGRTFHMVATSSIDKTMKIWRLDINYQSNEVNDNTVIKYEIIHNFTSNSPVGIFLYRFGDFHGILQEL